jgi:hypothetical protein
MKGYPKSLKTWADVEYVTNNFERDEWRSDVENLISDAAVYMWVPSNQLGSDEEGVTDDTHKVVEDEVCNEETGVFESVNMQYVKKLNLQCLLAHMKFCETEKDLKLAIEEVRAILG